MQVQYLLYQSSGWVNLDDVEVTIVAPNAATEVTKYYYFGGQRVAMRKNGVLTYLHADHLGSTVLETNASGVVTSDEKYKAYGKQRDTGAVSTDHRFTGQKEDASGLQYFASRYYDPSIGTFVSPDTMVPSPELASDYNRYAYARGRVMNAIDPSGHEPIHASNYPCSYTACVKDPLTGKYIPVPNWTPDLQKQYYGTKYGNPGTIEELPAAVQPLAKVLDKVINMELHYDKDGNLDPRATIENELGDVLSVCAEAIGGTCGVSLGANGALLVGPGVKASADFYVDQDGNSAFYLTGGGGGYAVFTMVNVTAKGISVIGVRNADVDDMAKWSVQAGGSGKAIDGASIEWIAGRNSEGELWQGLVVSEVEGYGMEIHASATYSYQLYRSKEKR